MAYQDEINYREQLNHQVLQGKKLTKEEIFWLETHCRYSSVLGYPYLDFDIVKIKPNVDYTVRIHLEKLTYQDRVCSVIFVPAKKGQIIADFPVVDYRGRESIGKPIYMLTHDLTIEKNMVEVHYRSELGLLQIYFFCEFYDEKLHIETGGYSSGPKASIVMLREDVEDNKVQYRCNPGLEEFDFDSFVFSVEWEERP